ncbi:MAG: NAD(P)(+) transhydrogenase [Candidatus Tectimicrobiota bacterium]|nr:MAG: NAD(P)(+) transhydrogenase [Candidatus Tectomicrobia bacterium]
MPERFDVVVIGSGPAGQKAAIQGAKAGRRVVIIEQGSRVGGACVHYGTIPSKTLRETAVSLAGFRQRCAGFFDLRLHPEIAVATLTSRLRQVVQAHERFMHDQLQRNGVAQWHGRARFLSPTLLEVVAPDGTRRQVTGEVIVIATGSRPRTPPEIPVDHEHIFDSDSLLSMLYLPASLTVLGSGIIASEYASIFAALGVEVTMVDRAPRPLGFLDAELSERFVQSFTASGGRFLGGQRVTRVAWDGLAAVVTTLESGETLRSEKALCALGRVANVEGLNLAAAGLRLTERGFIAVDAYCRTAVPHIYAVGDVIGPPALASCAMEQGRRAVRHALGLELGEPPELIPVGIYTIPELASVGFSEQQARQRYGQVLVGRARFDELARGQIAGITDGLLKLVADAQGRRLLGVQIIGEGATELIHLGQMALLAGCEVDTFIDHIFNFPTLAEAYRVAALDIAKQRTACCTSLARNGQLIPAR